MGVNFNWLYVKYSRVNVTELSRLRKKLKVDQTQAFYFTPIKPVKFTPSNVRKIARHSVNPPLSLDSRNSVVIKREQRLSNTLFAFNRYLVAVDSGFALNYHAIEISNL